MRTLVTIREPVYPLGVKLHFQLICTAMWSPCWGRQVPWFRWAIGCEL